MRCCSIRLNDHFIAFNSILIQQIHNNGIKIILFFSLSCLSFISIHFVSFFIRFFLLSLPLNALNRAWLEIMLYYCCVAVVFNAQCAMCIISGQKKNKYISFFIMWTKNLECPFQWWEHTHVTCFMLPSFIVFVSDYMIRFFFLFISLPKKIWENWIICFFFFWFDSFVLFPCRAYPIAWLLFESSFLSLFLFFSFFICSLGFVIVIIAHVDSFVQFVYYTLFKPFTISIQSNHSHMPHAHFD